MFSVAVTVVGFTLAKLVTVMLGEPGAVTAVAPCRFVPVRVTGTAAPRTPDVGAIEVSVACITVNGTVLLFPPGVVTRTW